MKVSRKPYTIPKDQIKEFVKNVGINVNFLNEQIKKAEAYKLLVYYTDEYFYLIYPVSQSDVINSTIKVEMGEIESYNGIMIKHNDSEMSRKLDMDFAFEEYSTKYGFVIENSHLKNLQGSPKQVGWINLSNVDIGPNGGVINSLKGLESTVIRNGQLSNLFESDTAIEDLSHLPKNVLQLVLHPETKFDKLNPNFERLITIRNISSEEQFKYPFGISSKTAKLDLLLKHIPEEYKRIITKYPELITNPLLKEIYHTIDNPTLEEFEFLFNYFANSNIDPKILKILLKKL